MYKSLTAQTLHDFARPHDTLRRTPIESPAAWRGGELPYLDMELAKGDAQLLSNHTPARKRHLLRLWVSLDTQPRFPDRLARLRGGAPLLAALARARIGRAVRGRHERR